MRVLAWIAAALLAGAAQAAPKGACTVTSPQHTVALVELFTSEGCPYCPAADRWMRELPAAGLGRERVVPLALHVDYWNDKGWTDRFAQARFTDRQREYKALHGARALYTPQVMLAGEDTRRWREPEQFAADVQAINARPSRAAITLAIEPAEAGALRVRAQARTSSPGDAAGAVLHVAAYENGLSSTVSAGNNRGMVLEHDYVVRQWFDPLPLDDSGSAATVYGEVDRTGAGRGGVAAFVQVSRTGEVLQALALPYCDPAR